MPRLFGRDFSRAELMRRVGHLSQVGGVRLLESTDGPSRGVRLLEFRTGTGFEFKVGVERGMDVGSADYCGASLAWIPPTMLAGPWYFEQQTDFGWLRTALGGFNNTCGLTHIGNPEEDDVSHYNFPARPRERFGVHDRAALIPGELLSFGERWEGDVCVLEAKGRVTQAQAYGEVLTLERTYRAWLGESRFTMSDVVTNEGHHQTQHMMLYHINAGFPFVDEGSELLAPFAGPPRLLFGTADVNDAESYAKFIAPHRDWVQQTFEHRLAANAAGRVPVAIVNPGLGGGRGLYVRYDPRTMPRYIEWRMMGEGQYAVGIEPCSNGFGREAVRNSGEAIVLQPGESRRYEIEVGILDGPSEIAAFREEVENAASGHVK
jgi:Domain of unknown function (DUF4432)